MNKTKFIVFRREVHEPKQLMGYNTKWVRKCSFTTEKKAEKFIEKSKEKCYINKLKCSTKIEYKIEEEE